MIILVGYARTFLNFEAVDEKLIFYTMSMSQKFVVAKSSDNARFRLCVTKNRANHKRAEGEYSAAQSGGKGNGCDNVSTWGSGRGTLFANFRRHGNGREGVANLDECTNFRSIRSKRDKGWKRDESILNIPEG